MPVKTENLSDFGIRNISGYATEVNLDRAIPELYDGLKPVLRRVAFTASQYKTGETIKSARLSGKCMGELHPHGDCLSGDTEFYCLDGSIKTIRELTEIGKPVDVLAYDEDADHLVPAVAHSWRIGQIAEKKYHIHLSDGSTITCTANHPFYVRSAGWTAAEKLNVGMPILGGGILMNRKYRKVRFGKHLPISVFHLTCAVNGVLSAQVRHHKNGDSHDDRPSNLVVLSREERAELHKDYLTGLSKGRETMFCGTSEYREAIRKKNSILLSSYNKVAPIAKATAVYKYIKAKGLRINEAIYEENRIHFSGAPKYATIRDNYGMTFKDLRYYAKHGIHLDTSNAVGLTASLKGRTYSRNGAQKVKEAHIAYSLKMFMSIAMVAYRANGYLDWSLWDSYRQKYIKERGYGASNIHGRHVPTKVRLQKTFNKKSCRSLFMEASKRGFGLSVTKVEIEHCESTPMYDFTVDKYHNAVIALPNMHKGIKTFVVAHNSSIYGAMQTMVHQNVPLLEGIGNWGNIMDPAAASRYTVCKLSKFGTAIFDPKYTAVTNMVPNYDGTAEEPVVLPVRLPLLVLNGADGIGVGITSSIPTFTLSSVVKVLTALLSGEKLTPNDYARYLKPKQHWGGHLVDSRENKQAWLQLMQTGRAKVFFEPELVVDAAKKSLTISEWPAGLNPEKLIPKIRQMPECQRAFNSKGSMTFTIECKKQFNAVQFEAFVEKVRKLTRTAESYRFNVTHRTAKTVDGITTFNTEFLALSIPEFFMHWCRLRLQLEKRSLEYQIAKQQKAIDYSKLLIFACSKLSVIFASLKQSDSAAYLVKHLGLTKEEANQILDLKVRSLSKLDQSELRAKLKTQEAEMRTLHGYYKAPKQKIITEFASMVNLVEQDAKSKDKRANQSLTVH